jgi:formylglycine-generating enzyme required for sulfatase activity
MKKHLTLPPPTFQSMGVSVPPAIESVVRHALEKEVEARIDSIPTFLRDLHAALNSSPVVAAALRETVGMDPNKTVASMNTQPPVTPAPNLSATAAHPPIAPETNFGASFDSMAGTVSGAQLDKLLEDDAQRKQREERERREQEQQDRLERMTVQAKELQERLDQLSGSMPPALGDPEATHVQGSSTNPEGAASTNARAVSPRRAMVVDITPKRKGPSPFLFIGAAFVVLILAGVGVGAYLMLRSNTVAVTNPPPTPTPVVPGKAKKADLVNIDAGSFLMGRNAGPPQETPAHAVIVQQFLMDRTEVTNTEYADFVRETNHAAPSHWIGNKAPFGQDEWPVVNVSFDDAMAFASWRSKRDGVTYRLPTEEEWEYAARNGERSDLYPWGPEWQDKAAVVKDATPATVGSRPAGKNKWGVLDLIGNVWEWTGSKASVYPGNRATVPHNVADWVTIRGGCYVSDPMKPDAPVSACLREFVPASTKTTLLGFRLVRNP